MNASFCLRSPRSAAGGTLLFVSLLALSPSPATAQLSLPPDYAWRQFSPPGEAGSSVRYQWHIDPRGEWVVFVGDVESSGAEAVYSRRRNGSELRRLSPYGPVGAVQSLELSADGRYVIYRGDLETAGLDELWSVPMEGPASESVSLAGSFVEGGAISSFSISPDGQYLLLRADKLVDERFELWSVPIAGPAGAMVRLNPALVADGDVENTFEISPDSSRVAYVADQGANEAFRAWSVPIAGPSAAAEPLVSGILAAGADVTNLEFTPDGTTIVLRGDLSVGDRFDLYSVPADGSAFQVRITNDSSIPGPTYSVGSTWGLHPDGVRVAYVFDEDAPNDARGLGEQRLSPHYIQDKRLNGDPVAGGRISTFRVFPDSAGTIYYSDELVDERFHLFTVDSRIFGDGFEEGTTAAWPDAP